MELSYLFGDSWLANAPPGAAAATHVLLNAARSSSAKALTRRNIVREITEIFTFLIFFR
jgi:hypothetical protein